jgi:hypothetical protein
MRDAVDAIDRVQMQFHCVQRQLSVRKGLEVGDCGRGIGWQVRYVLLAAPGDKGAPAALDASPGVCAQGAGDVPIRPRVGR